MKISGPLSNNYFIDSYCDVIPDKCVLKIYLSLLYLSKLRQLMSLEAYNFLLETS